VYSIKEAICRGGKPGCKPSLPAKKEIEKFLAIALSMPAWDLWGLIVATISVATALKGL
jgi:hypothetical protein